MTNVSPPWKGTARVTPRAIHNPPRVLLADDDTEMRQLVTEALQMDGCEVHQVADGRSLAAAITRQIVSGGQAFDLIITDNRMPVYTGLDVVEAFNEAQCPTPVIVMTAFGDDATRARTSSLGALLFDKPFEIDDLRTAVVNILHPAPPSSGTGLRSNRSG